MQNQLSIRLIYEHLSNDREKKAGFESASNTIYLPRHLADLDHEMTHALESIVLAKKKCRPYEEILRGMEYPHGKDAETIYACMDAAIKEIRGEK